MSNAPVLDIDDLIADRGVEIIVCCGSGGVGKTTTAAAIGLRAAEAGRKAVVLTIDPAKRLAQSLGLTQLDNTPRPVTDIDTSKGGSLDAMMLDMKRTFDEVVLAHSEPGKAEAILANPFYQAVSSSFAGTQEYMAMEKLGQLKASVDDWDLIVVDTPPSRSALDFLDAPNRLGSFLDGRFIRLLSAPARASGRAGLKVFAFGVQVVTGTMTKILGGQMLQDVQTFVAALDTMFGGFRERADQTSAMRCARRPSSSIDSKRTVCRRAGSSSTASVGSRPRDSPPPQPSPSPNPSKSTAARSRRRRPLACCACTPPWSGPRSGSANSRNASHADTPEFPWSTCRPCAPTCTTSTACARWGRHWRDRDDHDPASPAAAQPFWAAAAIPSRSAVRHDVMSGRLRSRARRSRSVIPPQTPNSVRLSNASARHCASTGHDLHTALASCWALPLTKSASGS